MNEDNKRLSFGYEDTDKKIEIELYGLEFEIKNLDNIEELKNINQNNENEIEAQLENILGKGAIEKINKKRKDDGYKKLDIKIELNILGCIFETYATALKDSAISRVTKTMNGISKEINDFGNNNREQRRNYNNYRKNNYRRNNYRRY